MSDEKEKDTSGEKKPQPYSPPRIIEYGRAVDLTGGGTGSRVESNMSQSMKHP